MGKRGPNPVMSASMKASWAHYKASGKQTSVQTGGAIVAHANHDVPLRAIDRKLTVAPLL